ncbi:arylesterase [Acidobacteria bacterium AH-259-G07]|nr:arylesterase [Acidobacteria bacterium AH-259-G07]
MLKQSDLNSSHTAHEPKVILILGDSLTAGYGLDPSEAFPALIQQKIDALGWNFKVMNGGLSGDTSADGLRRIDWLLRSKIEFLVLELGANDALRGLPLDETERNLQAIIDKVRKRYPEVKVVIAGMLVPPNLGQEYTERFRSIFPELAKRNKVALIPFLLEGVAGRPELNLPDGIHPTATGHEIIAETLWKVLGPLLADSVH